MALLASHDHKISKLYGLLARLRWSVVVVICIISSVGFMMLYSAANGHWLPWALPQIIRFGAGFILMIVIACVDLRVWRHVAYPLYAISFLLLVAVEVVGAIGMGAQRWISLGPLNIQPSELMKIALILALARYLSRFKLEEIQKKPSLLVPAIIMILMPMVPVLKQPDLGTALLLGMIGVCLLFASGVKVRYFISSAILGVLTLPIGWYFLRPYQQNRILTFLDPERDPLGAGYHILQSKIALGSGGFFGKGFMAGSQSHLNFLPEKQTDFIFTMFSEEFGFLGALCLLFLYLFLMIQGVRISLDARGLFEKFVSLGIVVTLFIYVFINMSMVMGLVPVVGIPLPFISYGGTALLTLLISFGLLLGVDLQRYRGYS